MGFFFFTAVSRAHIGFIAEMCKEFQASAITSAYLACCGLRGQRLCLWQERQSPVETTLEFHDGRRRRKRRKYAGKKRGDGTE